MSNEISNVDLDLTGYGGPVQFNGVSAICTTGEVEIVTDKLERNSIRIPLTLEEPALATSGKEMPVGFETAIYIKAYTSGNRKADQVKNEIAYFQRASLGLSSGKAFDPSECSGKRVRVIFTTAPDQKGGFFQNAKFVKA